jgi:radical SAM superfamily enzyme YgiQ (UPF0313 family)
MRHSLFFNLSFFPLSQRPLGPYRIAHWLRENNWDVEVIEYALHWDINELKELVKSRITSNTVFFGLSHLFYAWSDEFDQFCFWVKQQYPHIIIISGSAAFPGFNSNNIDYYIRGYGENALIELLKYIDGNGVCPTFSPKFLENKKVIDAIHSYPSYPMKSLMVKYEDRDFIQSWEWLGIEFSRGCKFHCAFCNYPILGVKGDYSRDADDAKIQMQDAYDRFGITNYVVSDDTFNDRTDKIIKFADIVEEINFNPYFTGFIRADLLATYPAQKYELARMGFNGHYYGIESFNHKSAKSIGKGMDPQKIQQALVDIKNFIGDSYRSTIGLIIGLPEETEETIMKTQEWLINNWQGQNFISWGLEIYNPNGVENLSKMSLNYLDYGYTYVNQSSDRKDVVSKKYEPLGERFIWKNKHMDFYKAQDLANKLNNLHKTHDFRLTPFDLHGLQLANPNLKLTEIIQKKTIEINPYASIDYREFVKPYINLKLNLAS